MDRSLSLADKLTNEAVLEREISTRTSTDAKPRTISLPEGGLGKRMNFFNEGTIITIISQGKGEYLNGLETAIKDKNDARIQLHCEAIIERTRKDSLTVPGRRGLDDIPVIVDVMYGNTWLAKHMLIAQHTHLALTTSVWSGGKLNENGFRVREHRAKKSKASQIDVLVILIPPKLSQIEIAMLKAVPENLSEVHVSGPSVAWSAAGLAVKWTPEQKGDRDVRQALEIQQVFVPAYEQYQQRTTVQQQQVQQNDTKQQQQQQQQYAQDGQNHQQQQQQQIQEQGQHQQQQEQHQNAQTEQQQHQNEQQQQGQQQEQQQNQQQHDAATNQGGLNGMYREELDGGFVLHPHDQEKFASLLSRIDFQSMDATQSVRELLRLRERLITIGLG